LLRFMYAKDEVVICFVTYALFLILEDTIKLIWGVNPDFVAEPYAHARQHSRSAACATRPTT